MRATEAVEAEKVERAAQAEGRGEEERQGQEEEEARMAVVVRWRGRCLASCVW